MSNDIVHDTNAGRFSLELDGSTAVLQYELMGDGDVDFQSTWVPPEHRGHGVGAKVVAHALAWARAEGLNVVPSCWFVKEHIERGST